VGLEQAESKCEIIELGGDLASTGSVIVALKEEKKEKKLDAATDAMITISLRATRWSTRKYTIMQGGVMNTIRIPIRVDGTTRAPSRLYGTLGQNCLSIIAQAQLVPRAYKASTPPTTTWREDLFLKDVNPASRPRQFGHLQGRDLYDALLDLSRRVQAQELNHVFGDLDVLIIYGIDVERCAFEATGLNLLTTHGLDMTMTKHTLTKRYGTSIQTVDDKIMQWSFSRRVESP
jgi:hypothetical protein